MDIFGEGQSDEEATDDVDVLSLFSAENLANVADVLLEPQDPDLINFEEFSSNRDNEVDFEEAAKSTPSFDFFSKLNNSKIFNDELLYPNSQITKYENGFMLLTLLTKHNLSYQCLDDIIQYTKFVVPKEEKISPSVHLLREHFSKVYKFERKNFCKKCMKYLDCNNVCDNDKCSDVNPQISHFVYFDLTNQLKAIFSRANIRNAVFHRQREKQVEGNIESIEDGTLYKNCAEFLDVKHNISLALYTDGVNVFTSKKQSIWPVFLAINTLPQNLRHKTENMLCLGVWYDEKKPDFNTFLRPALPFFRQFHEVGIPIEWEGMEEKVVMKGLVLNYLGDSPARSGQNGMKQHNATNGCNTCTQTSVVVDGKRALYKYEPTMKLRTTAQTLKYVKKLAKIPQDNYLGVMRLSILYYFIANGLYVESMGIDIMHLIYSGIMKLLMRLWFTNEFKSASEKLKFNFFDKVGLLNKYLRTIKIPQFLSRKPRDIDSICFFATVEFKDWLYYYSIPLLHHLKMPLRILHHHALLVQSIYILNSDSISPENLARATRYLNYYVSQFEEIYGVDHMVSNVHYLLHLALNVERHGNLFVTSCMEWENMNGRMKRFIQGTRHIEQRILEFLVSAQCLPYYLEKLPENSGARKFYKHVQYAKKPKQLQQIDKYVFAIGLNYVSTQGFPRCYEKFRQAYRMFSEPNPKNVYIFKKLQKDGMIYSSRIHDEGKMTMSHSIEYGNENSIGLVECYFKLQFCNCPNDLCNCKNCKYVALVQTCEKGRIGTLDECEFYCKAVIIVDSYMIVDVHDIKTMCVWLEFNDDFYCSRRVNQKQQE